MNLLPLLLAAAPALAVVEAAQAALGYVVTFAIGVAVTWVGHSFRGSAAVKDKLDATAERLVAEKFEGLANGITAQLESQGDRIGHVEARLDSMQEEGHRHELKVASEINAVRVMIAKETATREQVAELLKAVQDLNNRVTQLAASRR